MSDLRALASLDFTTEEIATLCLGGALGPAAAAPKTPQAGAETGAAAALAFVERQIAESEAAAARCEADWQRRNDEAAAHLSDGGPDSVMTWMPGAVAAIGLANCRSPGLLALEAEAMRLRALVASGG